MTGLDADALDRLLDEPSTFPLVADLREAMRVEVDPSVARAHLTAIRREAAAPASTAPLAADVVPIDVRRGIPSRAGRRTLVAALAAVLILMLGSSSALAAAQNADPGDALYGLKRTSERVAVALRRSPESKALLHLKFADRRLAEIKRLAGDGKTASALGRDFESELAAASAEASLAVASGADESLLDLIARRLQTHIDRLGEILARAPDAAQRGLQNAIDRAREKAERTVLKIEGERDAARSNGNDKNKNKDKGKGKSQDKPKKDEPTPGSESSAPGEERKPGGGERDATPQSSSGKGSSPKSHGSGSGGHGGSGGNGGGGPDGGSGERDSSG